MTEVKTLDKPVGGEVEKTPHVSCTLGYKVTRKTLGLPENWEEIEDWIDDSRDVVPTDRKPRAPWQKKNPEIPVLENYQDDPGKHFWDCFPKHYPSVPKCTVDIDNLKKYVDKCWLDWTLPQKNTALKAVAFLEAKKSAPLLYPLPGLIEKNAPSAIENGEFMTDVLVTWVKKGFVAGPFVAPPMEGFRGNPLMAAVQKTKVRPILNLSLPKGRLFNDAVNGWEIDNLQMSTPRIFADSILRAGKGALMSKTDIQDAYKLIPIPVTDWRYYGFKWLRRFFVDTTTVFGSKTVGDILSLEWTT